MKIEVIIPNLINAGKKRFTDKALLSGSVCIRCGKDRVISKIWVDRNLRGNPLTRTEAVCPDSVCQKIVDEGFDRMRERKLKLAERKLTLASTKSHTDSQPKKL